MIKNETEVEGTDHRILFASLLVRAARVDYDYADAEKKQINKILKKKFNLTETEVEKTRIEGETLESNTIDTVQITRQIKREIPFEFRKALAEDLWSIVLADDKRTDYENSFMRTCIKLIGLSDVDGAKARHAVLKKIDDKNE